TVWYSALSPVAQGFLPCCTVSLYRAVQAFLDPKPDVSYQGNCTTGFGSVLQPFFALLEWHFFIFFTRQTIRFYSCLSQNPPPRFLLYQLVFPKRTEQSLHQ